MTRMRARIIRTGIEIVVVGLFALSCLMVAVRPGLDASGKGMAHSAVLIELAPWTTDLAPGADGDLVGVVQNPPNIALWSLLLAVVVSCAVYLASRARSRFAAPAPVGALIGLAAGAIWPWISGAKPEAALILAMAAPAGLTLSLLTRPPRSTGVAWSLGLIAGWLTVAAIDAATSLAYIRLDMQSELAALVALLALSLIGAQVQLWLGQTVTFAVAIIWGMLGIAAASLSMGMTVPTACVLGIATMAVVVVRITT